MDTQTNKFTFIKPLVVGFLLTIIFGITLGFYYNSNSAVAADTLPKEISSYQIGVGGLNTSTVKKEVDEDLFAVWSATDNNNNECVVAFDKVASNSAATCIDSKSFNQRALGLSLALKVHDEEDANVPVFQVFMLPDGADAKSAVSQIKGSKAWGQVIARYGVPLEEKNHQISVVSDKQNILLLVPGKESHL